MNAPPAATVTPPPDPCIPPDDILSAFKPPTDIGVAELLEWPNCPRRPGSRRFNLPAARWFSSHAPTKDTVLVSEVCLPSSRTCRELDSMLPDAPKEGFQSVLHPTRDNVYLPLWIVRVWKWADALLVKQQGWRERLVWVEKTAVAEGWTDDLRGAVMSAVRASPWLSGFPSLQNKAVSSAVLAEILLSYKWLNDEVINCLVDLMAHDMRDSGIDRTTIALTYLRKHLANPTSNTHQYYAAQLASGAVSRLFIPCNIENMHWIPVEINVPDKTIYMGDSAPHVSRLHVPKLVQDLRAFLGGVFPESSWQVNATALETGLQRDSNSCGIATVNAIERRIFPAAKRWSPSAPGSMRATYFRRCIELGQDPVSRLCHAACIAIRV